jgi:hypothetical protein
MGLLDNFRKNKADNNILREGITDNKYNSMGATILGGVNCNIGEYSLLMAEQIIRNISAEAFNNLKLTNKAIDKSLFVDAFIESFTKENITFNIYEANNKILDITFKEENKDLKIKAKKITYNNKAIKLYNMMVALIDIHKHSLIKSANQVAISNAFMLKMGGLRDNQINTDENILETKKTVQGAYSSIENGSSKFFILDSMDSIEQLEIKNIESVSLVRDEVFNELAMLLNLPLSYFNGTFKSGLGNGNGGDIDYRDKGIRNFTTNYIIPFLNILGINNTMNNYSIENLFKEGTPSLSYINYINYNNIMTLEEKKQALNQFYKDKGVI